MYLSYLGEVINEKALVKQEDEKVRRINNRLKSSLEIVDNVTGTCINNGNDNGTGTGGSTVCKPCNEFVNYALQISEGNTMYNIDSE